MKRKYTSREFFNIECIDCGSIVSTNSYRRLRCEPCRKSCEYRTNMLDYKWRLKKALGAAKYRAKDRNLEFNLTLEHLIELWDTNEGKCVVTKRNFDLNSWGAKGQANPNSPSIDRIEPKLGYVKGNVRLITYHANISISEYGLDTLLDLSQDLLKTAFR